MAITDPKKVNRKDYYLVNLEKILRDRNVRVVYIKKKPKLLPLFRNLLSSKAKIIHIHWIYQFTGFSRHKINLIFNSFFFMVDVLIIKYLLKRKIIWTVHNLISHELFFPKFERVIRKLFAKFVDYTIVHCNIAKKIVINEYGKSPNKIYIIPHGNYLSNYKNYISRQDARKLLNIGSNNFIFLFFGSIRPHKDIELLIRSFRKLQIIDRTKLMVIGNPINTYRCKIVRILENIPNILYKLEYIPDNDIQNYMNAADIVVIPYKHVLTSGEVLLAMTFGKAIIAPRLGCIIDLLDEKGAFLYNPKENESLLMALRKALENKDKLEEMGQYNLKLARVFEWKKIGTETKKVYENFFKK